MAKTVVTQELDDAIVRFFKRHPEDLAKFARARTATLHARGEDVPVVSVDFFLDTKTIQEFLTPDAPAEKEE